MLKKLMIIIFSLLFIISCNNNVSNPNDSSSNGNNNNNDGNEDVFDVNNYTNAYDSKFNETFNQIRDFEGLSFSYGAPTASINKTDNILIIPYVGMSHPTTMKYCFIEAIVDDTGTPKIIETSEVKTIIYGSHQREDGSYASDTGEAYIDFPNYKYNDYGNYKPTRYLMIISSENVSVSGGNYPSYAKF
ncbi:hypothetical protein Bint_1396 [Brachyspira intermedia PWS/A]|uniref:Lipoprotein n=1 Tax=Brachyspira intermedia (strain ATCC 51140 / PWS/A) TaxID=1045858 RepID=G0EPV5_BRAIP|nr:hypothetical protein [Brachyspira intermedia]AEM22015.1 hypothetical protein Bint_1396 [Brachyspira intermedia PWS/A]